MNVTHTNKQLFPFSKTGPWLRLGIGLTIAMLVVLNLVVPSLADDVTGTATVTGGALTMSATDHPAFPETTLDGTDKTQSDTINISVADLRGSGAGWNLQITSTTFDSGAGKTLPNNAMSITAVSATCTGDSCTSPTNSIGYPLTVPADATPPTAVKFFNAADGTGMGNFNVVPTLNLFIPATTFAGTYQSTITITVGDAP